MDRKAIASELDRQVADVVGLLTDGSDTKLERAMLELVAWFDLWREASDLPDAGMWREAGR
jgi:hypothetical protein